MDGKIEVPRSKKKILGLMIGSMVFVAIGIYFIVTPEKFQAVPFGTIIGVSAVGFFGTTFSIFLKQLISQKWGLIIDESGIINQSNALDVGLIEWRDILGFETMQVASTKFILIQTDQPDKYIDRGSNSLIRRSMKANLNMYGTPLSISTNTLKMQHTELEDILEKELHKRSSQIHPSDEKLQ